MGFDLFCQAGALVAMLYGDVFTEWVNYNWAHDECKRIGFS